MARMWTLICAVLCSVAYPIGLQHAIFRSQSTQGATWTGTATITNELMRVSVYANYLDVELEWTFMADGTRPAQYADALEIVGNMNLDYGSVVVGMILWNGDKVLMAKLRKKEEARNAYEQVVDRDSPVPPRPRDPVILEDLGNDNYDLSIFPVTFEGTRKMRMRYLVPITTVGGARQVTFPYAFTATGKVTIVKSDELTAFSLAYASGIGQIVNSDSVVLTNVQPYLNQAPQYIIPSDGRPATTPPQKTLMHVVNTGNLYLPGQFACVSDFAVARMLDSVKALPVRLDTQSSAGVLNVYALVGSGATVCSTGTAVPISAIGKNLLLGWANPLYVYSGKPLDPQVQWHVYFNGELIYKCTEQPQVVQSGEPDVESKLIAASQKVISLQQELPKSMAATFGFVDTAFALLALESDSLPNQLAAFYGPTGVPVCHEEDVYADSADMVMLPAGGLYAANNNVYGISAVSQADAVRVATGPFDFVNCTFVDKSLVIRLDYSHYDGMSPFDISLYSIDGKCLAAWTKEHLGSATTLRWSPRMQGYAAGAVVVRVRMGREIAARTVSVL